VRHADSITMHRVTCTDDMCPYCQNAAEMRAEDTDPEYDVEAAENSYERHQYGEPA